MWAVYDSAAARQRAEDFAEEDEQSMKSCLAPGRESSGRREQDWHSDLDTRRVVEREDDRDSVSIGTAFDSFDWQLHSSRCWLTLIAFSLNTGANAMLFMNFVTVSSLSAEVFSVDEETVPLTYAGGLLTVLVFSFFVFWSLPKHSYMTFLLLAMSNAASSWLRWYSVVNRSFALCMLSTVLVGVGFTVCVLAPAVIAVRWFPPQMQTLATSIGVQANYAGWCIGAFIIPTLVTTVAAMESFLFYQSIALTAAILVFLLCHDENVSKSGVGNGMGPWQSVKKLFGYKRYWLKLVPYAILGGVSFAIPAVQDIIFVENKSLGLDTEFTKWSNTVFISVGVVTGIVMSLKESSRPVRVLIPMFYVGVLPLLGLTLLTDPMALGMSSMTRNGLILFCMGLAGASSLGFIGIALSEITREAEDVNEAYSAGAVEWVVQLVGGILSYTAATNNGFLICGALVGIATLWLLVVGVNPELGLDGSDVQRDDRTSGASMSSCVELAPVLPLISALGGDAKMLQAFGEASDPTAQP